MKKNKRRSRRLVVNTKKRNQIGKKKKIKRVWPTKFQKSVHTEKMFHHLFRKPNEKSTETSTHYELRCKSTRNENVSTTFSLEMFQNSLATGLKARGCSVGVWRHKMFPSSLFSRLKFFTFPIAREEPTMRDANRNLRERRSRIVREYVLRAKRESVTFARSLRTF